MSTGTQNERIAKARRMAAGATARQIDSRLFWKGVRAVVGCSVGELKQVQAQYGVTACRP